MSNWSTAKLWKILEKLRFFDSCYYYKEGKKQDEIDKTKQNELNSTELMLQRKKEWVHIWIGIS